MAFTLIGVVHLLPLPGAPGPSPGFAAVRARARHDAAVLADAGFDALIVENLGDAPFRADRVDPHVLTLMAVLADELGALTRAAHPGLQIGVNVLRNDVRGALAVAVAAGAAFVRANVHTGATWTDQGLIQGEAHDTLRYRRELGAEGQIALYADVLVKHGVPAGADDLVEVARETALRGRADGLIVTGRATGAPTALGPLGELRAALPGVPLWVGSGVTEATAAATRAAADGAIVGTALHEDADLRRPLCPRRAARLRAAFGA